MPSFGSGTTVKIATTDPLPLLVDILRKYQRVGMYTGRGEQGAEVDVDRPWTTGLWSEISAYVPEDRVPLMLGFYSDGFTAAKRSHHPIKYVTLLRFVTIPQSPCRHLMFCLIDACVFL